MRRFLCVMMLLFPLYEQTARAGMVQTNKPYTYELLEQDLKKIMKSYKNQIEIKEIGKSHFGIPIWAIKLGKGKKNILFIGSHHGREWLTSTLLMKMLETYASAYKHQRSTGGFSTEILNEVSIWFIPMLNPDGVAIQQSKLKQFSPLYRKNLLNMNEGLANFERWKANAAGVDLNRQYPSGWNELNEDPSGPSYKSYKGSNPLVEPEVVALTNFVKTIDPAIAIAYHTAGREIYWSYRNGIHYIRDYIIARKISKLTDYPLKRPEKDAIGGGFTDWFITAYHRPGFTIEISYLVGETNPPLSVFQSEWKRNRFVGLMLAAEAKKININR
ncbi:carboxypeptidase [Bacillus sp. BRMEA1]|uniref:M14 family zinc carboxypeptidase n=1 Tax=Neobacillus endophyticus TaxID=2738405 RepID=UPI0015672363|nr:M14 family zinc carboxypeptidase [Neobacillus endophyticus]NRD78269.1 carboxypeptidase [Neobacillus endophyticus]